MLQFGSRSKTQQQNFTIVPTWDLNKDYPNDVLVKVPVWGLNIVFPSYILLEVPIWGKVKVTICRCTLQDMSISIFIWTLGWTLAFHLPETYFLFKNLSSQVWRNFRAMRIFCIDGHYFAFSKIMEILKLLFLSTTARTNQKKLFIYYNFLLKVVHTRDLIYGKTKRGQTGCVVLSNLLKDKATVNLSTSGTYRFTRKYPFT